MPKKKLTSAFIKSLGKPEKRKEYFDTHESGLFVRVYKSGNKTFFYRYRTFGKMKQFKIGSFPVTTLAEARKEVGRVKISIDDGIDPQAERQANRNKKQPKTFNILAEKFKKRHVKRNLKESTQKSYINRIDTELMPFFGGRLIESINRNDVIELLNEIIDRGQDYQANRVRAILSSMFNFGLQNGIAEFNPVKTVKPKGKEEKRTGAIDAGEIKDLWLSLNKTREPSQSLLKILLLLGQRLGETSRMQWKDIKNGVWTIPKEQTKAGREHTIPLPPAAIEIIEGLRNDSPYVFESSRRPGQYVKDIRGSFSTAKERAGLNDLHIHDLRHTAATQMTKLGTDRTVLGKVLNHKSLAGDTHVTARYDENSYMREKRQALNRWSHKLQQIIDGNTEAKIHKIA